MCKQRYVVMLAEKNPPKKPNNLIEGNKNRKDKQADEYRFYVL